MSACLKFLQSEASPYARPQLMPSSGHDHNVLSSLKVVKATPGHLRTSLIIEKRHLNNHKTIHGGVLLGVSIEAVPQAVVADAEQLTDTVTSLAVSTLGITAPTGVSVNISCEFVRPGGREGDELIGIGEVIKIGVVSFFDAADKLVAFGSHTKHVGNSKATTSFSEDGEREIPLKEAKL
ncbi:acyl-coenzyme A thioesterase 13, partial [Tremellales sp. Uapishka_1]